MLHVHASSGGRAAEHLAAERNYLMSERPPSMHVSLFAAAQEMVKADNARLNKTQKAGVR